MPDAPADDPLARLLYRTLTGTEWVDDGHLTLEQRQCSDMADAVRAGGYVRVEGDLMRAALREYAHGLRFHAECSSIYCPHRNDYDRAREALARLFPEEAKAGGE